MAGTFGNGRGRLGRATRAWAAARPGAAPVLVELAKDAADLADAARSERNGAVYLRAAERLQSLIERVERSGSGDGGPGAGDVGGDGGAGELAEELGAGPEVGDAAVS